MRVAVVTGWSAQRAPGLARYATELTAALRRLEDGPSVTEIRTSHTGPRRVAWSQVVLPVLVRRTRPTVCHVSAPPAPLAWAGPLVVTIHDVSFEDASLMGRKDRLVFRAVVPRAARRAARVLTVSERTKRELVARYRLSPERVVVTPNAVDPAFVPGDGSRDYALSVGAIQPRKHQLAALEAARAAGLPLVVAGPEKDAALAAELRARGATVRGYVEQPELVRLLQGAACLVQSSRYEGFGLPVLEAMACGTPVVAVPEPALQEVAGDAAVLVPETRLAEGIRRALEEREQLVAAGLERAREFSWRAAAERTLAAYREILGT